MTGTVFTKSQHCVAAIINMKEFSAPPISYLRWGKELEARTGRWLIRLLAGVYEVCRRDTGGVGPIS